MQKIERSELSKSLSFDGTDLEVRAQLDGDRVTINVMKSGSCVHKVTISDAVGRMEHSWLADMFAREDQVRLSEIQIQAADYVSELNINQG